MATQLLGHFEHTEVGQPRQGLAVLLPPYADAAATIGIEHHLAGAAGGAAQEAFIRQADLDPQLQVASQVVLPDRRFVVGRDAAAEGQPLADVQGKGEQAHHEPFFGLGRMQCELQRLRFEHATVEVADL